MVVSTVGGWAVHHFSIPLFASVFFICIGFSRFLSLQNPSMPSPNRCRSNRSTCGPLYVSGSAVLYGGHGAVLTSFTCIVVCHVYFVAP
ncbi:hypothetical protein V8E53_011214 [Lactarius tabidus]